MIPEITRLTSEELFEVRDNSFHYTKNAEDKEYPDVVWNIFGWVSKNKIVVSAQNQMQKGIAIAYAANSPIVNPQMIDRRFGIDVADDALSTHITAKLWDNHKDELIPTRRKE